MENIWSERHNNTPALWSWEAEWPRIQHGWSPRWDYFLCRNDTDLCNSLEDLHSFEWKLLKIKWSKMIQQTSKFPIRPALLVLNAFRDPSSFLAMNRMPIENVVRVWLWTHLLVDPILCRRTKLSSFNILWTEQELLLMALFTPSRSYLHSSEHTCRTVSRVERLKPIYGNTCPRSYQTRMINKLLYFYRSVGWFPHLPGRSSMMLISEDCSPDNGWTTRSLISMGRWSRHDPKDTTRTPSGAREKHI